MGLVLGGTAAVSAATIAGALEGRLGVALALGFGALVALALWAVLARGRAAPGGPAHPRTGLLAIAAASALALADRHLIVASRGVAPDDVAVAVLVVACIGLALRAPHSGGRPFVTALALAAYALVFVALVAGTQYHSDAVANVHRAAELFLTGSDPYRTVDTLESLDRFGMDRALATHLEDGTPLRSFNYPPLAFLIPAPAVALGLADVRVLYAALLLLATVAASAVTSARWRPYLLAAVIGNVPIARQHVLAGIDPSWAILLGASLLVLARAASWWPLAVSAVLLGLAAAARQPAWFVAPFVISAVARDHGGARAVRYAAIACAAFAIPALPFLASAPGAFLGGVLAPIVLPLEPHGIGLVRLGVDGLLPLLPRGVYTGIALAALLVGLVVAYRRRPAAVGLPAIALAPLYVGWRALQNYFALTGVFAVLAIAEDDRRSGRALPGGRRSPVRDGTPVTLVEGAEQPGGGRNESAMDR